MNLRPSGYEPDELPGCSTPRQGAGFVRRAGAGFRAVFGFGGDLLSRVLGRSTIGVAALNGRVRDGIGCFARGCCHQTWRPHGGRGGGGLSPGRLFPRTRDFCLVQATLAEVSTCLGSGRAGVRLLPDRIEACRAISTGQLNALPRLHLRPIDVVVFHGPQGRPGFEGGFPLRCLQRLSCPHIATLHCRWHDNRSTSGAFTPVLSY